MSEQALMKNDHVWPIYFRLQAEQKQVGRWTTLSWSMEELCLHPEELDVTELATAGEGTYMLPLELFRDERMEYRFNLNAQDPHLFLICAEENEVLQPVLITVAQGVAARYMDGDYVALHVSIPLPIQAWMEAYLARHGELVESKGKRGRNKQGCSSDS